jgi:hypothetical protein
MSVVKGIVSTIWLRGVIYLLPIIAMGTLLLFWNSTNPAEVGPSGVFVVFILLYLFWLGVMFILLRIATFVVKKLYKKVTAKHSSEKLAYYIASVVAFVPVLLLALQSVGQLELRDVVLVFIFAALAIFYIIKRA